MRVDRILNNGHCILWNETCKENFLIVSCAFLDCLVQRTNFFLSLLNAFLLYVLIFLLKRNHWAASDVEFLTALMVKDFKY